MSGPVEHHDDGYSGMQRRESVPGATPKYLPFITRIEQGAEQLAAIMERNPELGEILAPEFLRFQDGPGMKEAAKLAKAYRDKKYPGLVETEEGEETPEQLKAQLSAMKQQMEQMQQAGAEMQKALAMGLKDRQRFLQEQMPDAVAFVAPHFATLDSIAVAKEQDISNAKETRTAIDHQHMTQREKAITQARETLFSQTVREMDEAGVFLFRQNLGDESLNKVAQGVQDTFKGYLSTSDPVAQSRAFALGAAAPALLQSLRAADAEITRLNNELSLRAGSSPNMTPASPQAAGKIDYSKMSPRDLGRMVANEALK